MGVALGCIHLSLDDFLRLTLDEFNAVYKAYTEDREATYRNAWEQMRLLGTISISPHVKRAPTPQKLIPFPWDKTKHRLKTDAPQISKTDALARFKRRAGKQSKS